MNVLEAITPLDGRYRQTIQEASAYFSEYALMRARLAVELRFLEKLITYSEPGIASKLPEDWRQTVGDILEKFDLKEAANVKEIEARIGHDVKAVVDYASDKLGQRGLGHLSRFVHLGLTSEDVNNIAYAVLVRDFIGQVYLKPLVDIVEKLVTLARRHKATVMLARTHWQPAVPTTFGKFIANYAHSVAVLAGEIDSFKFAGKIGGAVGDHAALKAAYPELDWLRFSLEFVEGFGLEYQPASTQILPHDRFSRLFSIILLLNSILSNLCRDLWLLGSLGLLSFRRGPTMIHSSTMPQKANPLSLENAEGALDLSAELSSYLSKRLISSRLHRDLSDSVLKRFYGTVLSTSLLGLHSLSVALNELEINTELMRREVEMHPEVLAEKVQILLRRHGVDDAFELVRQALAGGWGNVAELLVKLDLPDSVKRGLLETKPEQYIGEAERMAERLADEAEAWVAKLRRR